MSSSRSFSQLTAGAALCATSLAAAGGGTNPLAYSTVNSWSVSATLNGYSMSGSSSSPAGLVNYTMTISPASPWFGTALAYNYGVMGGANFDAFGWRGQSTGPAITTTSATMTFSVTFTSAATFFDLSVGGGPSTAPVSWTANSAVLSNGDVLAAGTYTFSGSGGWSGNTTAVGYGFLLAFSPGGGGAVPLPGAAGLAACGLVGLSRRRRR